MGDDHKDENLVPRVALDHEEITSGDESEDHDDDDGSDEEEGDGNTDE